MSDSEKPKSWRERRQSIKHKWLAPFVFLEWLCERLSYFLGQWALLDICGHIGRFGVLVSIIVGMCVYVMEADERRAEAENQRQQAVDQRKAKHYQAWQIINAAQGQRCNGGRIDALQDLNRDGISLTGVDISKAYLPELNLEKAILTFADLSEAGLWDANFAKANLEGANLAKANLVRANLAGADLADANLPEADFSDANLAGAKLFLANLTGALLLGTDLAEAILFGANLAKANLQDTDFPEATLSDANLTEASLRRVNLAGASLFRANLAGAVLHDVDLVGADLTDANLAGAYFIRSNLKDIKGWQSIQNIKHTIIYDVNNPPEQFLEWAKENGAVIIEDEKEWKMLLQEKRQGQTKEKQ